MKRKRFAALAMTLAMLTGLLAGCGRQNQQEDIPVVQEKGRYVETEQALPEEWADWTAKQLFVQDEKLHLVMVRAEDERLAVRELEQTEEGFEDVTGKWLGEIVLPADLWNELHLMRDGNGAQYLFSQYADGEEYRGHLWRSDGDAAVEITPEEWSCLNEDWGIYEMIFGIAVLDNGQLFANGAMAMSLLSGQDGSTVESEATTGGYAETVLTDGQNIYLVCTDSSGSMSQIEKRPEGKKSAAENIPLDMDNRSSLNFCAAGDSTIIAAGSSGIFRYAAEEKRWEKLMSGMDTDFSLSDRWCTGMAAMENGTIYALFSQNGGNAILNEYRYDPDAVVEVTEVLKLYAVEESYLLQNAVALYHRTHPEIMIETEYAYSIDDRYSGVEYDYNEVYRKLNTMLMSGDAPDILVLDHLNPDSFIEKGLLADLGGVLAPMEEDGELLKNITDSYRTEDGSMYVIPMQFGFSYITGRDITVADMQSIETLAAFLKGKQESYMGCKTVEDMVDLFYPYFCGEIVKGKGIDKETLREKLEALKTIADNCGIVEKYDNKKGRGYNLWDLASEIKLAIEKGAAGFNDCMFDVAMTEYIKGEFTAFENQFIPSLETAVCTKSQKQETAKDFIRFALSEQIQDQDYYSGFPVNARSLEKLARRDRSDAEAVTSITGDDGGEVVFEIKDFSETTAQKLVEICETVNRPVKEDAKIREVLIDSLGAYLRGEGELEEALSEIEKGLNMYLAE